MTNDLPIDDLKNPQYGILTVQFNGNGRIVRVFDEPEKEKEIEFYHRDEIRRFDINTRLYTNNACVWRLVDGRWR